MFVACDFPGTLESRVWDREVYTILGSAQIYYNNLFTNFDSIHGSLINERNIMECYYVYIFILYLPCIGL